MLKNMKQPFWDDFSFITYSPNNLTHAQYSIMRILMNMVINYKYTSQIHIKISIQTCNSLFVATLQYVSSRYANDLCGFDRTSHACNIRFKQKMVKMVMNGLQPQRQINKMNNLSASFISLNPLTQWLEITSKVK